MTMMISKFHKLIQSKILWTAFAVLIAVAFVGMAIPSCDGQKVKRQQQLAGRLFGEDVSRNEFAQAYQSTRLSYLLQYGPFRIDDQIHELISQSAWQRLAMLKKAAQLDMIVTPEQTVTMIQRQPIFTNRQTGQFDTATYNAALQQIQSLLGMSARGVENYYAEQVLIEKLSSIPAQGALVTEEEIKKAFHLYTDKRTVEYTSIPRSLAETPKVTEEDAKNYFERNKEQFLMPEKAIVDYVQFAVADQLENVVVTDAMVSGFYENNKQRFLKPATTNAVENAAPEFKPLEEVKDDITEQIKTTLARQTAADLADQLVSDLADESNTFKKAVEAAGLELVDNTPAFTLTDPVKGIGPTAQAQFQRAAFALEMDETHYYSDPVVGRDFVYVISLTKKLPSFLPSFDIVRDEATESARMAAEEMAYIEKAEQVHKEIQTSIKEGSTFAKAIAKYKLEPSNTEPFDVTTTLEDEFGQQIKGAAILYEQGKLTDLISTPNEYLVAYVVEVEPGDETTTLPSMREELSGNISSEKARRLVASWQTALLEEAEFVDLLPRTDDES